METYFIFIEIFSVKTFVKELYINFIPGVCHISYASEMSESARISEQKTDARKWCKRARFPSG